VLAPDEKPVTILTRYGESRDTRGALRNFKMPPVPKEAS
jgi:hypothetical protein